MKISWWRRFTKNPYYKADIVLGVFVLSLTLLIIAVNISPETGIYFMQASGALSCTACAGMIYILMTKNG